ncbi:hypothetical protein BKE38_29340 [Pseudoroseomonas deserti]|uniref:Uncharacterized protein n=1 Tax=Teichococcus deserti TaxID=1817963 RepID=A0A1V2GU54_9PROT|nr:hypothetical protein [Pseudoroseomonas deserti]ONG42453.1 hypothetical protein BKE38_29340 [Pseudoroseomonas deserti]
MTRRVLFSVVLLLPGGTFAQGVDDLGNNAPAMGRPFAHPLAFTRDDAPGLPGPAGHSAAASENGRAEAPPAASRPCR